MTDENGQEQEVAQVVTEHPTEMNVGGGIWQAQNGSRFVQLVFFTAVGTNHFFLVPSDAKKVAETLMELATQAESGIVLPKGAGLGVVRG